jgi:hypothetical protein
MQRESFGLNSSKFKISAAREGEGERELLKLHVCLTHDAEEAV